MKILFLHQNFPGQFLHLASALATNPVHELVAICQPQAPRLRAIKTYVYKPDAKTQSHHYLSMLEDGVRNGQAVARILLRMKEEGFEPDLVMAHPGWGEALYVKDVFPQAALLNYFEFYYHAEGADCDFDPEFPLDIDGRLRLRTRNALHLLNLQNCDVGVSPTQWQKSVHPPAYHSKIAVIHEGVNSQLVAPKADASFALPDGSTLSRQDEVITYVARNLEPYRGFHHFMRALPQICTRRPNAKIIIVGGDEVSYGSPAPEGRSWREHLLRDIEINPQQVHFLGKIPYLDYVSLMQVSSAHIYLTYPFVLSWSMLEAMAAGGLLIPSNTAPVREVITHGKMDC